MLILALLFGCSEDIKTTACESLDGDTHILTASAAGGLEEVAAKFHIQLHNHQVEIWNNS